MRNFFEFIKGGLHFNKFEVGDLIVVEYSCPLEDEQLGLFSQSDYMVHVLSGKKNWKTVNGEWALGAGDTLYLRKGAAIINQFFEEEFCMLGFFIPDSLIQESLAGGRHGNTGEVHAGIPSIYRSGLALRPLPGRLFPIHVELFQKKGKTAGRNPEAEAERTAYQRVVQQRKPTVGGLPEIRGKRRRGLVALHHGK